MSKFQEGLQTQRQLVEQLRIEAAVHRMTVSESVAEIMKFCQQRQEEDVLMKGFAKQNDNPFKEKGGCLILWAAVETSSLELSISVMNNLHQVLVLICYCCCLVLCMKAYMLPYMHGIQAQIVFNHISLWSWKFWSFGQACLEMERLVPFRALVEQLRNCLFIFFTVQYVPWRKCHWPYDYMKNEVSHLCTFMIARLNFMNIYYSCGCSVKLKSVFLHGFKTSSQDENILPLYV